MPRHPIPPGSNLPVREMIEAAFYASGYQLTNMIDDVAFEYTRFEETQAHVITILIHEVYVPYEKV